MSTVKSPPKFAVGDRVRVRYGVRDPDYADLPLGGWAGAVKEIIEDDSSTHLCLIELGEATLEQVHPVYFSRCERDGLNHTEIVVGQDDLDADQGDALPIEQPTNIVPAPLDMSDRDDRIRHALGLTSDDLLPEVDDEKLAVYYRYLSAQLSFPLETAFWVDTGRMSRKRHQFQGLRLINPREELDENGGLLCEGQARSAGNVSSMRLPLSELENIENRKNRRFISDYLTWFSGWW
jgi:hypothetical protein